MKINCCECNKPFDKKKDDGLRCELCRQENFVRWLINMGHSVRDGIPDGHTPVMTPTVRREHNIKVEEEKKKLIKLRNKYPDRAKAYAKKNKGDYYAEAVAI